MSAVTSFDELADRAADLAEKFRTVPALDLARGLLNEAGVLAARNALAAALEGIGGSQELLIARREEERRAKETVDSVAGDIEYDLAACFTVRANKQWLVKAPDGTALAEEAQRSMTADEKRSWIAAEAAKTPQARAAAKNLRDAEHAVALCQADLNLAERRFSACKASLNASVAMLNALAAALPTRSAA